MDLSAAIGDVCVIKPGDVGVIPTGFALSIPNGYEGQVRPRSGLATDHRMTVVNSPATIDSDYRGEIKVALINLGASEFEVSRGMRIAQLVIAPVARVEWDERDALPDSSRGAGGFGHTGE
jgi:dUTP pyrophosphatase